MFVDPYSSLNISHPSLGQKILKHNKTKSNFTHNKKYVLNAPELTTSGATSKNTRENNQYNLIGTQKIKRTTLQNFKSKNLNVNEYAHFVW